MPDGAFAWQNGQVLSTLRGSMDEEASRAIQTVTALISVALITIVAIVTAPEPTTETVTMTASAFVLIAALMGVHYGIRIIREEENGDRQ